MKLQAIINIESSYIKLSYIFTEPYKLNANRKHIFCPFLSF